MRKCDYQHVIISITLPANNEIMPGHQLSIMIISICFYMREASNKAISRVSTPSVKMLYTAYPGKQQPFTCELVSFLERQHIECAEPLRRDSAIAIGYHINYTSANSLDLVSNTAHDAYLYRVSRSSEIRFFDSTFTTRERGGHSLLHRAWHAHLSPP